MERIINYRDIPTDKKTDILNALEKIGFFPAYGGVKTMQRVMEKSVPGSGPQFYFVFREDKLLGYNFLIGDTKRYNTAVHDSAYPSDLPYTSDILHCLFLADS